MKFLVCLFITIGVAFGAITPSKPDCRVAFCTMDLKICPDGTPAPVPADGCCPSLSACKTAPKTDCRFTMCAMVFLVCADGTPAPVAAGECCPSMKACKTSSEAMGRRSNPLGSLGSLLSGSNLLQSLSSATHGTDLGSVISILNLLNNVHQLSNDIHQIPLLINQTLTGIISGTGQAGQIVVDQLMGAINHQAQSRDLLGSLGQSAGLLSSISNLLPKGTSISTVLSILKLLNNVNQLNNDIHQIPVLLNQTLSSLVGGAGEASGILVQQLLSLVGGQSQAGSRDLLGSLGQSAGLLSGISNLLPKGTSISTVLSILKLLNNVNQLNNDIHQIPLLINQTLTSLVGGAGDASGILVQQLLSLVGAQSQAQSRNLLGSLGQNAGLLSGISNLLPQGTSISTVLSLLKLLNNVNQLNNDVHQIPAVLQQTLQNLLSGVQNLIPQPQPQVLPIHED